MGLILSACKRIKSMPTFSQTLTRITRSNKPKKVERAESIARSVPEISVHVVEAEEQLRRKGPVKEIGFKFSLEDRWR
jgi:hypothetical protein